METPRAPARLATLDAKGRRLWVYPQSTQGTFTKYRGWVSYALIILYLVMPWIEVDGLPMIQLDVVNRQFVLFGNVFWPQDVKYLVFLFLGAGVALFLFTSLAGRVWCGWACPQTVFLEFIFRRIETWLEGDRNKRIAFDKAPWTFSKIWRKSLKQLIFLAIAAIVANTFLAYFAGSKQVVQWMTRPPTEHWGEFLFMMVNVGLFYFDFAWFREQFCTVLCPYARFQAALTDAHTFQVTYDYKRGEPRGKLNKVGGDCVDCGACVRVCPTGIDIRNGTQLECIGCARCIDACDDIMTKVSRPLGLIRYDSEARLENSQMRLIRPRVVIYVVLLAAIVGGLLWSLAVRQLVEFTVLRSPGEPYTILQETIVSNHLSLRLVNKDRQDHQVILKMNGLEGAQLIVPVQPFPLPANSLQRLEFFVNVPKEKLPTGKHPIELSVFSNTGRALGKSTIYILGPVQATP